VIGGASTGAGRGRFCVDRVECLFGVDSGIGMMGGGSSNVSQCN
jgi:hypothetical protein